MVGGITLIGLINRIRLISEFNDLMVRDGSMSVTGRALEGL